MNEKAVGARAINEGKLFNGKEKVIALAGNPNVVKSTLFNRLTGMHLHTGNRPGKTAGIAYGHFSHKNQDYILADIPGTYSLAARSAEEEVARDALLFGEADIILLVCDAACLRRSMNLTLQILEVAGNVIIAVNLMDKPKRKGVSVDTQLLSQRLGVPVIPVSAGSGMGIDVLLDALSGFHPRSPISLCYGCGLLQALAPLTDYFEAYRPPLPAQWLAMRVCENEDSMLRSLSLHFGLDPNDDELKSVYYLTELNLVKIGFPPEKLCDVYAQTIDAAAAAYCDGAT